MRARATGAGPGLPRATPVAAPPARATCRPAPPPQPACSQAAPGRGRGRQGAGRSVGERVLRSVGGLCAAAAKEAAGAARGGSRPLVAPGVHAAGCASWRAPAMRGSATKFGSQTGDPYLRGQSSTHASPASRAGSTEQHLHALVAALGEQLRPRPCGADVLVVLAGQQSLAQRGVCGGGVGGWQRGKGIWRGSRADPGPPERGLPAMRHAAHALQLGSLARPGSVELELKCRRCTAAAACAGWHSGDTALPKHSHATSMTLFSLQEEGGRRRGRKGRQQSMAQHRALEWAPIG